MKHITRDEYQSPTCPNCEASSLSCDLCHGTGVVPWPVYWDWLDAAMESGKLLEFGAVLAGVEAS